MCAVFLHFETIGYDLLRLRLQFSGPRTIHRGSTTICSGPEKIHSVRRKTTSAMAVPTGGLATLTTTSSQTDFDLGTTLDVILRDLTNILDEPADTYEAEINEAQRRLDAWNRIWHSLLFPQSPHSLKACLRETRKARQRRQSVRMRLHQSQRDAAVQVLYTINTHLPRMYGFTIPSTALAAFDEYMSYYADLRETIENFVIVRGEAEEMLAEAQNHISRNVTKQDSATVYQS